MKETFVYVSNAQDGYIDAYSMDIDPTGQFLVAAVQKSDRISVSRIDKADDSLSLVGQYPVKQDANCVKTASFPVCVPISQPTESSRNEY